MPTRELNDLQMQDYMLFALSVFQAVPCPNKADAIYMSHTLFLPLYIQTCIVYRKQKCVM